MSSRVAGATRAGTITDMTLVSLGDGGSSDAIEFAKMVSVLAAKVCF